MHAYTTQHTRTHTHVRALLGSRPIWYTRTLPISVFGSELPEFFHLCNSWSSYYFEHCDFGSWPTKHWIWPVTKAISLLRSLSVCMSLCLSGSLSLAGVYERAWRHVSFRCTIIKKTKFWKSDWHPDCLLPRPKAGRWTDSSCGNL